jgi:hypothetical protein
MKDVLVMKIQIVLFDILANQLLEKQQNIVNKVVFLMMKKKTDLFAEMIFVKVVRLKKLVLMIVPVKLMKIVLKDIIVLVKILLIKQLV